jgi:SET domain-containing protein
LPATLNHSKTNEVTKSKFTPGNFRLAVRRARAGRGLFALEPIRKGACIAEYVGPLVDEWRHVRNRYLFEVTKKKTINGWNRENLARFINHSCRPNCEIEIVRGRVFILAKRAIKEGEELAYDYGKDYFDAVIKPIGCRCLKCRP